MKAFDSLSWNLLYKVMKSILITICYTSKKSWKSRNQEYLFCLLLHAIEDELSNQGLILYTRQEIYDTN